MEIICNVKLNWNIRKKDFAKQQTLCLKKCSTQKVMKKSISVSACSKKFEFNTRDKTN